MLQEFRKYIKRLDENTNTKHTIYTIDSNLISEVEKFIIIPKELKNFYIEFGYGFFHVESDSSFKLMSPEEYQQINLKQDFYEFDPALEIYDNLYNDTKFLFFEVVEGTYLAIDKEDCNGKNAIYYFDERIANSLEEFIIKFDTERTYFEKD